MRHGVAVVFSLGLPLLAGGCVKADSSPEPRKASSEPALICPVGVGTPVAPGLMALTDADCPPEVILFGHGANLCQQRGHCELPCAAHSGMSDIELHYRDGRPAQWIERSRHDDSVKSYQWTWKKGRLSRAERRDNGKLTELATLRYARDGAELNLMKEAPILLRYDERGRIAEHRSSSPAADGGLRYLKKDGVITHSENRNEDTVTSFQYDSAGRLHSASEGGVTFTYRYSPTGLVLSESAQMGNSSLVHEYTHGSEGRLLRRDTTVSGDLKTHITYDYDCE